MACSDYNGDMFEAMSEFAVRDFVFCPYQSAFGGPEFALLFAGVVAMAHWYKSGGLAGPLVVLVLVGGRVMTEVAAIGYSFVTVALFSVAVGLVLLLRSMDRI